ncbi:hypothetical protein M0812_08862 [Anaeramoeba flamelloides]|uniref:Uncharacterized protein n=1 Tax=Anaeramoeba flamelloides TaxID=1746091 RepID=A0AAV7ZWJ9_9EUKA|nr:hypothetical protein M0812_08862 [Anaeramoeba flamelloides]
MFLINKIIYSLNDHSVKDQELNEKFLGVLKEQRKSVEKLLIAVKKDLAAFKKKEIQLRLTRLKFLDKQDKLLEKLSSLCTNSVCDCLSLPYTNKNEIVKKNNPCVNCLYLQTKEEGKEMKESIDKKMKFFRNKVSRLEYQKIQLRKQIDQFDQQISTTEKSSQKNNENDEKENINSDDLAPLIQTIDESVIKIEIDPDIEQL